MCIHVLYGWLWVAFMYRLYSIKLYWIWKNISNFHYHIDVIFPIMVEENHDGVIVNQISWNENAFMIVNISIFVRNPLLIISTRYMKAQKLKLCNWLQAQILSVFWPQTLHRGILLALNNSLPCLASFLMTCLASKQHSNLVPVINCQKDRGVATAPPKWRHCSKDKFGPLIVGIKFVGFLMLDMASKNIAGHGIGWS